MLSMTEEEEKMYEPHSHDVFKAFNYEFMYWYNNKYHKPY